MQQLLVMMQKITAEPDNTVRSERSTLESSAPLDSGEGAGTLAIVEFDQSVESDQALKLRDEMGSDELQESDTTTAQSEVIVLDETDSSLVSVSTVVEPSESAGDGYIKRWISKAVSWIKRLIGY